MNKLTEALASAERTARWLAIAAVAMYAVWNGSHEGALVDWLVRYDQGLAQKLVVVPPQYEQYGPLQLNVTPDEVPKK